MNDPRVIAYLVLIGTFFAVYGGVGIARNALPKQDAELARADFREASGWFIAGVITAVYPLYFEATQGIPASNPFWITGFVLLAITFAFGWYQIVQGFQQHKREFNKVISANCHFEA
jgi:hypothetical protein